jgi:hypothetical protein
MSSKSIDSSRSLDRGAALAAGVVSALLVELASETTSAAVWPNANEMHIPKVRLGGRDNSHQVALAAAGAPLQPAANRR